MLDGLFVYIYEQFGFYLIDDDDENIDEQFEKDLFEELF